MMTIMIPTLKKNLLTPFQSSASEDQESLSKQEKKKGSSRQAMILDLYNIFPKFPLL